MDRIIAHFDMNSYFASVEQQANPFLRGRPIAVCPYVGKNGAIIASSIEAKAKGIKTGMRTEAAMRLEPNLVLVKSDPAKYRAVTARIFDIFRRHSDKVEPYSIDEAFVDITGWVKDFDEAKVLAEIIKHEILIEVGEWLRCSVGISWTKFLAKFAGDTAPKGGCLAITPNNIDECLAIEVAAAWGIGRAMSRRLNELKIYTLFELKNFDPQVLRRRLGLPGYYLWCHVNGLEISQISSELVPPKSIGHSHCLPLKTTDKEYLLGVLYKLCDKTGRRLRQLDFEAATVYGQFACLYNSVHHISIKRSDKIFSTNDIFNPLADFLSKTALTVAVFKMSVGVTGLSRKSNQLDLFCRKDKQDKLSQTIDQINNRFGGYTITSGLMLGMEKTAPDQIAFRKI